MTFYKETNLQETQLGKIPQDWKSVLIDQISEVRRGASPRPIGDPKYFSDKGRGWVRISDVTETYKYLRKTSQYLSELGESKSVKVNPGDLIMSICATIGRPILVDMEACIHDGFVVFRNLSKEVDTAFLFYVLQKYEGKFASMRQTGTQGNLNTHLVGSTLIPLPPFDEQKRIVGVLGVVDSAIELADKVIAKTERLKKGLTQQLLTRGIGHTEYKDTPIGKAPKSWQTATLGEVLIEIKYGTSAKANSEGHGYPVLGIPNVLGGKINQTNLRYVELSVAEKRSLTLEDGDILLVRTNANPDYIGRCSLFENLKGIWLYASYLIRIRPDRKKVLPTYLARFLQSEKGRKQFLSIARTSAGNYNVNSQEIRRIIFNLPKLPEQLNEQQRIAEILSVADEKLESEIKERERLENIKKGLMDLLLTGKVRINVD